MICNRKWTRVFLFLVPVVAVCVAGQVAWAATVVVGNCNPSLPQFSTIQAAVTSVNTGGTVQVCPGTYNEQVTISKALTLTGVQSGTGAAAVIFPPAGGLVANGFDILGNPVAAQILVNNAGGNVIVERLTVDGTGNNLGPCVPATMEGIYFENTSGSIVNNVVRNQFQTDYAHFGGCQNGLAINVESLTSGPTVTITSNSVRAYQKNGITASGPGTGAGSPGPTVTISNNYIVGLGATAMNWQGVYLGETTAAENGIQVGFGAGGKVQANTVADNIWGQDTSSDSGNAASGILIFASPNVTVIGNVVGSSQFGIVAVTDSSGFCNNGTTISCGTADNTTITANRVAGTQIFDAVDACSNHDTVQSNVIFGSTESGVHIDDSCTNTTLGTSSGSNTSVTKNLINEACAGILTGTGTGNTTAPNTILDVTHTVLSGDVCPAVAASATLRDHSRKLQPSPYRPTRK